MKFALVLFGLLALSTVSPAHNLVLPVASSSVFEEKYCSGFSVFQLRQMVDALPEKARLALLGEVRSRLMPSFRRDCLPTVATLTGMYGSTMDIHHLVGLLVKLRSEDELRPHLASIKSLLVAIARIGARFDANQQEVIEILIGFIAEGAAGDPKIEQTAKKLARYTAIPCYATNALSQLAEIPAAQHRKLQDWSAGNAGSQMYRECLKAAMSQLESR